MSLSYVKMSEEVWLTCLTHALSTETEEITGLLLGDIQHSKGGNFTTLPRSDRQKDRVETNPEQLTAASVEAQHGRMTRVIGWYHSHPHITVLPLHAGRIQVIAFQSLDGKQSQINLRAVPVSSANKEVVIDLESSLSFFRKCVY
ncbi:LOW QUALITY PROTEIN: lys-63-specific deubiquitinase BRCC36-like [Impatiens glandulifera]|uniref:LOW QUALITY PROTEIN: lys-63-specific deubiquitinase BRCC36-like n=1 Tax=Impatiens glandulifera TaxID=253017 RepID=UPI001FB07BDB|nr:LOW QUALITY PROTEIN: lys-63-specific deubiquitinase BRCC36-like [Impatiens glandulifera]